MKPFNPTMAQVEEVIHGDNNVGWCRFCGNEQDGCEPDARNYECEECGAAQVYGAEEYVMHGWVS